MKRSFQIGIAALMLLVAVAAFIVVPPEFVPDGQASAQWSRTGPFEVTEVPLELVDSTRSTAAYGDYEGAPRRTLEGRIWLPDRDEPSPLILYSHGFMSSHGEAEYLGSFLATHGYITAAVDYPLTNGSAPAGPLVTDVINQPEDASFVIDRLLERNRQQGDTLYGRIDPDRIAAVGLSLGGLTTELLAFHPRIGDERIKAAVSIAGPTAPFTSQFFSHRDLPFLMLAGESDAIIPYEQNAEAILEKAPGTILVSLARASHTGFAARAAGAFRFADHPDEVVCPMLLENLERRSDQTLFEGDPAIGIVTETASTPCRMDSFERAMRPPEQIAYMRLVVFSFLESVLARDPGRRSEARRFLMHRLPDENPPVRVARAGRQPKQVSAAGCIERQSHSGEKACQ